MRRIACHFDDLNGIDYVHFVHWAIPEVQIPAWLRANRKRLHGHKGS